MKIAVLSSGGIDSTTCLSLAIKKYGSDNVKSIAFKYGQKHSKEIECSRKIAKYYNVEHFELDLTEIFKDSKCSLINKKIKISNGSYDEQIKKTDIIGTYVPFRNGLMVSSAASFMMSRYEDEIIIYLGIHADDVAGNAYADCSIEFYKNMDEAIRIGTYNKVRIEAPFKGVHKSDIVKVGIELKTPYELTWSCYKGGEKPCKVCGTCIDRIRAFEINGIKDPIL